MTQRTVTLVIPDGYASGKDFAKDCGFEIAKPVDQRIAHYHLQPNHSVNQIGDMIVIIPNDQVTSHTEFDQLKIVIGYLLDFAKHHLQQDGLDQRSFDHALHHFENYYLKPKSNG
jgi:hypothetical protein